VALAPGALERVHHHLPPRERETRGERGAVSRNHGARGV
jgi:hypothetical protein